MSKLDKDFFDITTGTYQGLQIGQQIEGFDSIMYEVVEILNNPDKNGAEGIAVAPIVNGTPDMSKITISYKGTNLADMDGDLSADVQQVTMGQKDKYQNVHIPGTTARVPVQVNSQFDTALAFAEQLKKDPRFKNATFDYTGHSLGAGLASYVAAEFGEYATVFSAPNIYRLLSEKAKKWVDAGHATDKITNYTHMNDSVGNFDQFGMPLVGKRVLTKSNKELETFIMRLLTLGGHPTDTFLEMFNGDGSIMLLFAPTLLRATAVQYDDMKSTALGIKKAIEQYEWDEGEEIMALQKHIRSEASGGAYSELEDHEIQDILKAVAPYSKGDHYYAHNPDVVKELKAKMVSIGDNLGEFAQSLRMAAVKAEASDEQIATSF
ncbi:hypothetical protein [Enterococcus wangshanyuanii]|uniref:Fungal lipase-like domain-containing protein n=1 Tax=Enterococcus wangshanyuanii TaxID=2005703 RepID=A0ABQ1P4C1_9ENTE|nr:hypothetical protein [Enterococcus wangshanyuanii]GGC90899.1 hypothetical protein GCM10011573_20640 [Enterococcus wangshanyuanii]